MYCIVHWNGIYLHLIKYRNIFDQINAFLDIHLQTSLKCYKPI